MSAEEITNGKSRKDQLNLAKIPSPANEILELYYEQLQEKLPGVINGISITGSIPLNDFHPSKSDIDFFSFSNRKLSGSQIETLSKIHHSIHKKYRKPDLSGFYMTWDCLGKMAVDISPLPAFMEGKMHNERVFNLDEITWLELEKYSIRIFGDRDIEGISDQEKVLLQLKENINSYWTSWMKKHSGFIGFRPMLLLLFPRLTEWSVLGVARQYSTLKNGTIVSKLEAGQYCLSVFPARYQGILKEAIEIRKDRRPLISPGFQRKKETLRFMEYTIARFNQVYEESFSRQ